MPNTADSGQPTDPSAAFKASGNVTSPHEEVAAAEMWQTEDFLAAQPYPMPEVSEESLRSFFEATHAPVPGRGSVSPGGQPTAISATQADEQTLVGFPYPPPFNQHEVLAPYTTYPYVTIGKLFFKQNGGSWVASAASIGNNAIWTAGHCVHVGNGQPSGWSTNMVFVPAYKDGVAPLGQWKATSMSCRTTWYKNGNPGGLVEDMGGAILAPLNGRKISQVVGWLGFAWNFARNQTWTSLGYPAAPPFNGQRLYQDTAPYANDGSVPGSPATIGIGCSMTPGCSGGPWVLGFGSSNWVNGDNSYRPNNQPLEIYSPYFGDNAHSLKVLLVGS
jgi:V8-like Glu-specific endopeptidase